MYVYLVWASIYGFVTVKALEDRRFVFAGIWGTLALVNVLAALGWLPWFMLKPIHK